MELHVYYSSKSLLRVSWGRVIDAQALRRHYELLKNNRNYDRNLKVITSTDVEELAFSLTEENMMVFRAWREEALSEYESIVTAFYNMQPVPSAYISYFSEFFDSPKSRMRQFSSERAALDWLLLAKGARGAPRRSG